MSIEEVIDPALKSKKTANEKIINEQKKVFMEQVKESIKQEEHQFIIGLRDSKGQIPMGMQCAICKGLVHQPMIDGNCGTTIMCKICVEDYQANKENADCDKCPVCKEKLNIQELIQMMAKVFDAQKFLVPKKQLDSESTDTGEGCEKEEMKYKDILQFFRKGCERQISCPQNCGQIFPNVAEAMSHFDNCPVSKTLCPLCFELLESTAQKERHGELCQEVEVPCPSNCGQTFKRKNMERHMRHECPEGKVRCTKCGALVKKKELAEHQVGCMDHYFKKLQEQVTLVEKCQKSDNGAHQIHFCGCSTFCSKCNKFLKKGPNISIHVSACGLFCMHCRQVLFKKHAGYEYRPNCSLACSTCKEVHLQFQAHQLAFTECGTICFKCKYIKGHDVIISETGCAWCKTCSKSINPGHEIVGQMNCGLFCVDCRKTIYRNHSYFRATKCAILCDTDEHNKIYKQLMPGHTLTRDGYRYWDCDKCQAKLKYSDYE